MTINILFLSITVKMRKINPEEAAHQNKVEKLYQKNRDQQISIRRFMS
ncbi:YrzI family small protein [Neobacillus novalis]|uniref:YrzI family small protein n=1 Tax=Neobacillus novalis TaxID=220687 RepID=A0AA95MU03_9BACI|nr:YrzI family small protein [Neobacillus novalis]WHY88524.1 YrzI family small protein [Neobacillus novalis]